MTAPDRLSCPNCNLIAYCPDHEIPQRPSEDDAQAKRKAAFEASIRRIDWNDIPDLSTPQPVQGRDYWEQRCMDTEKRARRAEEANAKLERELRHRANLSKMATAAANRLEQDLGKERQLRHGLEERVIELEGELEAGRSAREKLLADKLGQLQDFVSTVRELVARGPK